MSTLIHARADRMRWPRFHTRMAVALGAKWVPDGLEITVARDVADISEKKNTLAMSARAVGNIAYSIGGAVMLLGGAAEPDRVARRTKWRHRRWD